MRYPLYSFLCLCFALSLMSGCDQKKKNLVKISINHLKAAGDTVLIARTNMINFDNVELGKVVLDSAGKGTAEFELDAPVFAHVAAAHLAAAFFVSPGDELAIVPAKAGAKVSISFEGDGAAVNQFIMESHQIRNGLEKWDGTHAIHLNKEEFLKAKDSLQRGYGQLFAKLKSNKQVSAEMLSLMKSYTEMSVVFYQQNFAIGKDSSEIPETVSEAIKRMPIDTIALKTGMVDYALIASNFYQHKIYNAVYDEHESADWDSLEPIFPTLVEEKIKSGKYPRLIEDFFRVKAADNQIRTEGINPTMIKLAGLMEKEIALDEYKNVIREDVARWEKLAPGKPAPDFGGITPDGKKILLSDLRGKVVYIDIWATWCGYCIDEFPDSKKVQAEFKNNDQIAFLYVSVDRDTLAWKKMVAGDKVPKGLHLLNGPDAHESIWNLYHVWGIPRYLLIDAQGRMVATHAPRPSSGDVQAELRRLLTVSRVAQK